MASVTQTYDINGVKEVVLEGWGDVVITQDDAEVMTIAADEELIDKLKTEVKDGRLALGFRNKLESIFHFTHPDIHYSITLKSLERLAIAGAGTVHAEDLKLNALQLDLSGAGNLLLGALLAGSVTSTLSGAGQIKIARLQAGQLSFSLPGAGSCEVAGVVPTLEVHLSGTGAFKGFGLLAETAQAHISGMGKADVSVVKTLEASVSGMGEICYQGHPQLHSSVSGMGRIHAA